MKHTIYGKIPGYKGGYLVSIDGDVISRKSNYDGSILRAKWKDITQPIVMEGYRDRSTLSHKGKSRKWTPQELVLMTFIGPRNGKTVNHINGKKADNSLENLEWVTYAENERHSWEVLGKEHKPEDCKRRSNTLKQTEWEQEITLVADSVKVKQVLELKVDNTYSDIVNLTGINKNNVPRICNSRIIHLKHHSRGEIYETIRLSS